MEGKYKALKSERVPTRQPRRISVPDVSGGCHQEVFETPRVAPSPDRSGIRGTCLSFFFFFSMTPPTQLLL